MLGVRRMCAYFAAIPRSGLVINDTHLLLILLNIRVNATDLCMCQCGEQRRRKILLSKVGKKNRFKH